ncbi:MULTISPECIES: hypothetical protein [Pseudomonas]|uniref:hypothetical protein n=1 Tax=Pseudomonas TaxID=286 RepID=UPI000761F6D7|nr:MULTISPECIES: hypothetical protein [Pseudomonas]MCA4076428.1 hypothetical protein [Pseudomonas kurunegalensis]MDN5518533.1 hypothetical protein [Pseudomonas sp.]MDN5532534.1 hypothetical protein [Pseudomonas sp.]MDT3749569.1 hypothetical protein [Pseudomonas kurunegalensis]
MTMTDREMLELAAKAAGYVVRWYDDSLAYGPTFGIEVEPGNPSGFEPWSPLENDGDALRLAADLCINIEWFPGQKFVQACRFGIGEIIGWVDERGRSGSLRRAITVAAAKIGKAMQEKH